MSKMSKREFLTKSLFLGAASTFSPLGTIIESILLGEITKAQAQSLGDLPLRYVYIQQHGAPPRWFFDLILKPESSQSIISHPMITNSYTASSSGRYTNTAYKTHRIKGCDMPLLWKYKTSLGGRNISDLLDNMMIIQGVRGLNASHSFNSLAHTQPIPGGTSLNAHLADHTNKPLSAIAIGGATSIFPFVSNKFKSLLYTSSKYQAQASTLFSSFNESYGNNFQSNLDLSREARDLASRQITAINSRFENLLPDTEAAKKLMTSAIGQYLEEWQPLYEKYKRLVQLAITPDRSLVGITDKPIGSAEISERGTDYFIAGNNKKTNITDLRDAINLSSGGTEVFYLAESFATTEFLLKNNFTYSLRLGLNYSLSKAEFNSNEKINIGNDQHNVGRIPGVLINTLTYRAISACLLELIDQLKNTNDPDHPGNIFENTLIHLAGEFNRKPRRLSLEDHRGGTDHGSEGINASFFSGKIQQFQVVGDIYKSNPAGRYTLPTWGYGAPIRGKEEFLNYGHIANTVCEILKLKPLVTNANSVATYKNNELKFILPKSKIVEWSS